MSARGGASARSDLFASAHSDYSGLDSSRKPPPNEDSFVEEKFIADQYGVSPDSEDSPLQLEHMMGYSGDFRRTVLAVPRFENLYVKGFGSLVCIENLLDPHDQKILRSHDMPISALAVSPSGRYIASGQVGTTSFKGYAAPVIVWRTDSCRRLIALKGLIMQVSLIAFSTDEHFICGGGSNGLFYVWDVETGEVVAAQKFPTEVTVMQWVEHRREHNYTVYDIIIGYGYAVVYGTLSYSPEKGQWTLNLKPFAMPPGGSMVRSFLSSDLSIDGVFVYVGTAGGEVLVFRRDTGVFRACIPVCTNGVQGLATLPNGELACGGGDGSVCILQGHDMSWRKVMENRVDPGIRSLSLTGGGNELIISCTTGTEYRVLTSNLSSQVVGVGHTSPITCVAFSNRGSARTVYFATGTTSGELRVWDIADYACVALARYPKSGAVKSVFILEASMVISGWEDGTVRCHDIETLSNQLWYLNGAHRNGTTAVAAHIDGTVQYLVTGGADGAVRVWRFGNRELVAQFTEHSKAVSKVLIDVHSPNIIHSVGLDSSVLSYDIKASRRIICHMVTSGSMLSMTQRRDSEQELITGDSLGRLLYWDIDMREPVMAMQDPSKAPIQCCAVSPSGRFLAFSGDDQLLKVVDNTTGSVVALGQGHSGPVQTLAWTPDERQIITGGQDLCLCVWNFFLGGSSSSVASQAESKNGRK